MKKTRLLEIIREEISYALNENYNNSIEEEQLNEFAKIAGPIESALETAVKRLQKQDDSLTADQIAKLVKNKKTQEKVAPELKAALAKDEEEKGGEEKYTPGLGFPQTLKAIEKIMGLSTPGKRGRKSTEKAEEPKAEKPAKKVEAPKAEPMDDEDAEAAKAVGSDKTAQALGKTSSAADKLANLFQVKTTKEAKEKMKELAKKANSGDKEAKAFFEKNQKIIQAYRKAQTVKV
jgi:hypothetical protein